MALPEGLMARIVWTLVLGGAVWAYLRYFEWRNLYYPSREITTTPDAFGLEFEDVKFITEDNHDLYGWWIPHPNARGTVIHCQGNAGNSGDRVWLAADLHRLGLNVFLFDYRGYGRSRGLPTEQGTYQDARAAYEVVRARYHDTEIPPVIAYGQSLGAAVAVQLALDKPVRGLIVESAFTSVVDMSNEIYPWLPARALIRYRYDSLKKVERLEMPKLFAHSRTDDLIPFKLGRRLYEAAAQPKEFQELTGGHNDAGWQASPEYWKAIQGFVDAVFPPPAGQK